MKKVEGPLLGSRDKAFIFAGIQDWAFIFHGMGFTLIRTINFSGAGNNVLFFREFGMTTLSSFSQLILLIDCCLKIYTSTKNHLMLKFFHCLSQCNCCVRSVFQDIFIVDQDIIIDFQDIVIVVQDIVIVVQDIVIVVQDIVIVVQDIAIVD